MFSLPSIAKLEQRAAARRKADKKAKTFKCDFCGEEYAKDAEITVDGETYRGVREEWYSPLSSKPNGILSVCPKCRAHNERDHGAWFGEDGEGGYFECADCGKLNISNFSWELYVVRTEDGDTLCMGCAAKRSLKPESDKWLASEAEIEAATASLEALQAYKPQHLGCREGDKKLPLGCMSFRDTPEYEREGFNWFSLMEMGGWGGGHVAEVRDCARQAFESYKKVQIIIGEAGQFQLYLDIVVAAADRRGKKGA